jgi:multimeric flavodoxin WrbA
MKIVVLNGSPKGEQSITLHYVKFLQQKFPDLQFRIFHVSQQIQKLEKEEKAFQELMAEIRSAEGILWAFPLYFLLVPSQYKRFIELIWEKGAEDTFREKYAAVLTTSIHFFDHTAHNYLRGVCEDLGMRYADGFSADMYDLFQEGKRKNLLLFARRFFETIANRASLPRAHQPIHLRDFEYTPEMEGKKENPGEHRVVIVTDSRDPHTNLGKMVAKLKNSLSRGVEVFDLNDIHIQGGCLGCIRCGYDNTCAYQGKDEFCEWYRKKLMNAHILVFAGSIRDRYLSSRWKMFFDRSFFNTHTPSFSGKQIAYIISGPLSQIPNLRQVLEGWTELQQANLLEMVTDEFGTSAEIDGLLEALAQRLCWSAEKNYLRPGTFLGVGGKKIFRDDIYGRLRFPFRADHKHFKKNGGYDFPQRDYRSRLRNAVLLHLTKIPAIRKEIYQRRMKKEMIKPFQRWLEKER